jgi:hypothetical protein
MPLNRLLVQFEKGDLKVGTGASGTETKSRFRPLLSAPPTRSPWRSTPLPPFYCTEFFAKSKNCRSTIVPCILGSVSFNVKFFLRKMFWAKLFIAGNEN